MKASNKNLFFKSVDFMVNADLPNQIKLFLDNNIVFILRIYVVENNIVFML